MPHTLDTSDTLNELDELDDLIEDGEEQISDQHDDDSVVEGAEELDQVEDAEPGQDWAEDGTFIGQCELIEVPFRKTVKSKATVRAAFDDEHNCWRAGCYWKSLLKKSGCNEFGQSLSRANPGFETMAAAVNSVLTRMAEEAEAFDQRIAADILKFRDTDWFVADNADEIAQEQRDCEALSDGTGPRHPDEPKANEFGVFDTEVETVAIPLPKSWKITAGMALACDSRGWWRFGYNYDHKTGGSGSAPSLNKGEKFPSRKQCQLAALRHAIGHFTPIDLKVADKIAVLLQNIERDAVETITAVDPEAEADLQDAVHEIETAGGSVGQAPTEEEQRAKAEAIFRDKMRAGADYLASCTLARIDAESVFKTAKAEEKAAAESLRAIADRGPERLPLLEYAERERAKAESNGQTPSRPVKSVASDSWKSACVTELGLAKGVTQKLIDDGCDTIGRLEQRRADIAMKKEKWPRGIGKAAIDKIENAVLDWLKHNQPVDDGAAVDSPAVATPATNEGSEIDPEIGDVESRLQELYDDLDFEGDKEHGSYQSGREACERGDKITDCPLVPGDDQDQWLMGWSDAAEEDRELE